MRPTSYITLRVNGHDVRVQTDQEVTPEWRRDMEAHIKRIEAGSLEESPQHYAGVE